MDGYIIGYTAAILTSFFWTLNSILFAYAGRKIGATSVNAIRILLAVILIGITHVILFGEIIPILSTDQWIWIGLSGIIGLGIGDFALFAAFVIIGPRLSVLIMAMSPFFASIFGYVLLDEVLSDLAIIGIMVTIFGICSVILVSKEHEQWQKIAIKKSIFGSFLAFIGAAGQGIGIVFAKKGIMLYSASNIVVNSISASYVRMIAGAVFIWIIIIITGKLPDIKSAFKNKHGLKYTTAGAILGPFLGVTLSMVAVSYTDVGIAQTLLSLMPVFIIPIMWIIYREKTSVRGFLGAAIAITGVAILFML